MDEDIRCEDLLPPPLKNPIPDYSHLSIKTHQSRGSSPNEAQKLLSKTSPTNFGTLQNQVYRSAIIGRQGTSSDRNVKDPTLSNMIPGSIGSLSITERRIGKFQNKKAEMENKVAFSSLCSNYNRILLVINEKLLILAEEAAKSWKTKKVRFKGLLSTILMKSHKVYTLLCAQVSVFENNQSIPSFNSETYEEGLEEDDYRFTLASIKLNWRTNGKIHKLCKSLDTHVKRVKKLSTPMKEMILSDNGIKKIERSCLETLEAIERATKYLSQFDIRSAATVAHAAIKFKKLSPKSKRSENAALKLKTISSPKSKSSTNPDLQSIISTAGEPH